MAKIDFLQDSTSEYIYPITVIEAIYTLKGDTLIDVLNTHVDAIDKLNKDITYKASRPVPVDIGGIPAGYTFASGFKLGEVIDMLLHPMTPPSITVGSDIPFGTYPISAFGQPAESTDLGAFVDSILTSLNAPLFNISELDIDIASGLYCIKSVFVDVLLERGGKVVKEVTVLQETLPAVEPLDSNMFSRTIRLSTDLLNVSNVDRVIIYTLAVDTYGARHQKEVLFHLVPPILVIRQSAPTGESVENIVSGYVCVPHGETKVDINFSEFNSEGIGLLIPHYLGRVSKIIDKGGFDILPIFRYVELPDTQAIKDFYGFYTTTPTHGDIADDNNYISLLNYSCTIYFEL